MCGIIGYVGNEECAPILLDGLRRLEYRGYDSAGVAVHDGSELRVMRAAGKLSALSDALARNPVHGSTGIGHTRWATHGKPSEQNAHPHVSGDIAVVHNGIIENHVELKHALKAQGRVFTSDTDTEIVAHLVDLATRRGLDLFEAVRDTLNQIRGAYAIAVLSKSDPSRIVLAKNASPLVLGVGDGVMLAASDVPALLAHTRDVIFLEDGEIAEIRRDGLRLETVGGQTVTRAPTRITWSLMQAERGGYKHFMLKEIHEQPRAIEDTLRGRITLESGELEPQEMGITAEQARAIKRVVFLACGTSYHASLHGRYLVESLARVGAVSELASEFRYRDPVVGEGDLVVAVSQSGETADTLAAAKEAKERGARVLAVVNVQGSAIARARPRHALHPRGPRDRRGEHQVLHRAARGAHACSRCTSRAAAGTIADRGQRPAARVRAGAAEDPRGARAAKEAEAVARADRCTRATRSFSGAGSPARWPWRAR
jgi:glucosamine--fructose-6-phosphate aminotransferase (isomerizing)